MNPEIEKTSKARQILIDQLLSYPEPMREEAEKVLNGYALDLPSWVSMDAIGRALRSK